MDDRRVLSRPQWRRAVYAVLAVVLPSTLALPIVRGPLRGSRWIVRSANYSCWLGRYEVEKQHAFARAIAPGATVFDIGAHVGLYSLLANRRAGPSGRVIAFEPLSSNVAVLKRHASLNQASIEVVAAAVADRDGQAFFAAGTDNYTGRLSESGESVTLVKLDTLIESGAIPKPDVLKIDVEGAEDRVLQGAESMIRFARPVIFLAVHGPDVRARCLDLLKGLGYSIEALNVRGLPPDSEFVARPSDPKAPGAVTPGAASELSDSAFGRPALEKPDRQ